MTFPTTRAAITNASAENGRGVNVDIEGHRRDELFRESAEAGKRCLDR